MALWVPRMWQTKWNWHNDQQKIENIIVFLFNMTL